MKIKYFLSFIILFIFCVSCEKEKIKTITSSETSVSKDEKMHSKGKQLFEQLCASCHGLSGDGNGPAAQSLTVKPRDYRTKIFKAGGDLESIKKTIAEGYLGGKTGMIGWKSSFESPEDIELVAKYVRKLAGIK